MPGTLTMMVDCCRYLGYDEILCLVHQLQQWIVAGTLATMVNCWWYYLNDWVTWPVQKATKSYDGGMNANGGLRTIKIIWYQVYSGIVDGTLAIGYSLFILRLRQAMGGI